MAKIGPRCSLLPPPVEVMSELQVRATALALTSTLHELERLQARQASRAVIPPSRDINVSVTPDLG